MSIKDDTFEMLDTGPEKPKKSILLLVLMIIVISGAIPVYLQIRAATHTPRVAQTTVPVQPQPTVSTQQPSETPALIKAVINFDEASAVLKPDQMVKLQAYYQSLKSLPGTLQIDGYTDNLGLETDGAALSRQRAQAVAGYIKSLGDTSKITINLSSYGEKNPIGDNSTETGRQQNRRVELTFTPAP